ncbi:Liprin-beta-2 [Thelohanellus kitauei]|uniref:Liprin-beta-2 n=2 Tax=Thelohanellus kitauei TaxID=669202 RepID=A0A0C2JG25_THEKT|nr:Liprin-beta-2 [Thelohanellus kitauei]
MEVAITKVDLQRIPPVRVILYFFQIKKTSNTFKNVTVFQDEQSSKVEGQKSDMSISERQQCEVNETFQSETTHKKIIGNRMVRFSSDFNKFNHDELCRWLKNNGFETLAINLPEKITSGYDLRMMSDEEWDQELGLSSEFDRKRLRLLIEQAILDSKEPSEKLSKEWVAVWLEEIGLNQYRYEFLRRNINGTLLNNLRFVNFIDS